MKTNIEYTWYYYLWALSKVNSTTMRHHKLCISNCHGWHCVGCINRSVPDWQMLLLYTILLYYYCYCRWAAFADEDVTVTASRCATDTHRPALKRMHTSSVARIVTARSDVVPEMTSITASWFGKQHFVYAFRELSEPACWPNVFYSFCGWHYWLVVLWNTTQLHQVNGHLVYLHPPSLYSILQSEIIHLFSRYITSRADLLTRYGISESQNKRLVANDWI